MEIRLPNTGFGRILPCVRWQHTITSDWKVLENTPNTLGVCQDTGLIVNIRGIRGRAADFFTKDYELHSESDECEEVYVTETGVEAQSIQTLEMLKEAGVIQNPGRILEIGAAKGNFLHRFLAEFPKWKASAIEPSRLSAASLARRIPKVDLHVGPLGNYSAKSDQFDIIISNFVIAHLEDPFSFVEKVRELVKPGGYVLIGTPNFKNNPLDQFTTDHLSRFTPESLKALFGRYGFEEIRQWTDDRVPMWGLFRFNGVIKDWPLREVIAEALGTLSAHSRYASQLFEAAQAIVERANGAPVAVYGLSVAALIVGCYTDFTIDHIGAFFDDNHFFHGTRRSGKMILPLSQIGECGYKHIFISANPVYVERMTAKIANKLGPDCIIAHA